MYSPDYWCILKINGEDPHYRVFGSWAGSYAHGSSWRMNSGITKAEYDGSSYLFYGASGSAYRCGSNYGCHIESLGALHRYINSNNGKNCELLDHDTDWLNIDWILK